ncbi:MAG: asparagine synthase (glutamine-hydrolyzing) [Trueperaceae bacterium]|nr:asparagine synthase (glutamine-hydrolyzing) [Trueperaceae bacterium]MCW5818332.1 asparagine synthase (glutamine-hydrolyzing) [Trueperaceae bacterium]
MCGIAGIYTGSTRVAEASLLSTMAGELAHRGPDGVGLYLDGPFGMISTRLAIIDLAGGDQPLANEDGRYWVMQNGEIYNYPELMTELEGLGHLFRTRSDTEVIAHAFEEWGVGFLDRLNGEFALAVYDHATKRLLLARDRFGIRPLFTADLGGDLVFASEAKAILRHPRAERRIDPFALVETFTLWAVQPDRSAFPGIRELPAGHYQWVGPDGPEVPVRWWDIRFGPREGVRQGSIAELQEELLGLLDDATRVRLRADVPVGVYLSGGLDSSATTALARRHTRGPLEAFSVSFEDQRFDESAFQRRMADELGVNLRTIKVSDADVAAAFPDVVRFAEKPMLRTAPAPLILLSRLVRDSGFKVVLTGEGSDELLGGYNLFQEAMVRRFWARQPESRLRPRLLGKLYPYLSRDLQQGGGFMAEFFKTGMLDLDDPLYSHRPRFRTTARNLRFLGQGTLAAREAVGDPEARVIDRLPPEYAAMGPLGQAQYLEITTFLTGFLLHSQGDRMLAANSVEGRFPFLDVHVAEFAAGLPERLRLRDLREKYLLRKSLAGVLPDEINRRPKRPYRAPILRAFFGEGAPAYVDELLAPERLAATGLFNVPHVTKLAEKARRYAEVGFSESDEMGLVGVLSTMLLDETTVREPRLARAAVPTRVVEGARVSVDAGVRVS